MKVVITDNGYQHYRLEQAMMESIGAALEVRHCETESDVIELSRDADAMIVRQQPISCAVIQQLQRCRVIARYGVGVDNVDLEAATRRGIVVANVPNYANDDVAEHAIALLLTCIRRIVSHDRRIRAGEWDFGQSDPIYRIKGKVLGLLGFGAIARKVRQKIQGFEVDCIVHDPILTPADARDHQVESVDLATLLRRSDYLSLHAPLTSVTRHMISRDTLRQMKPTAILVNTARGGLVDTGALAEALAAGRLAAAGIDCHEQEPPPRDYALFSLENAVISDHKGWYSEESCAALQRGAAEAVVAVLSGRVPASVVNPEVLRLVSLRA